MSPENVSSISSASPTLSALIRQDLGTDARILAALIAGAVSIILAVYNIWSGKQRDRRMAQLDERKAELGSLATAELGRSDYE